MKTLFKSLVAVAAILLCASPALAVSKTALDGYRGVRFGENQSSALSKFANLFGRSHVAKEMTYYKGNVVGYRETAVFPFFLNHKFTGVMFAFTSQGSASSVDIYFDLRTKLKTSYGEYTFSGFEWYDGKKPEATLEDKVVDYTDEQVMGFVTEGNAYLTSRWEFEDGNVIKLETERNGNGMWTSLGYRCPALVERENTNRAKMEL